MIAVTLHVSELEREARKPWRDVTRAPRDLLRRYVQTFVPAGAVQPLGQRNGQPTHAASDVEHDVLGREPTRVA
jgi:hypothetical protein